MKVFGQKVLEPNIEVVVIPRKDYDIVISAQAVLDDKPFDGMCPRPKAPRMIRSGSTETVDDVNDVEFKKQLDIYGERRTAWLILESLKATPTSIIEWEEVKDNDPSTWTKWREELAKAFFTDFEISLIQGAVFTANGINQGRLDEARNRFLAGQARQFTKASSPTDGLQSTPSGEPVNDSK